MGREELTERPDEEFWGRPQAKRSWPFSGSVIVDSMIAALAVVVFVTIAALVALWPTGSSVRSHSIVVSKTVAGRVSHVESIRCSVSASQSCQLVTARVVNGRDGGNVHELRLPADIGRITARGRRQGPPLAEPSDAAGGATRAARVEVLVQRLRPTATALWLGVAFVILLLATGRLHGLRALIGLAVSLAIVLKFVIPSILQGNPAVSVALTGALAVMLVTIPLCYGIRAKAIAAWLGTTISLVLAVSLAWLFTHLTHLSGASSDEAVFLSATDSKISLPGLLLAGMVVGALGVLIDLTVSQASTVIALRRANPSLRFGGLFRGALDVGHDHIAATVNTLVFAYAGASLPILLIFSIGGTPFTDAVNSEAVAEEIVASLIGAIGLIASMPITTALAALLAPKMSDRQLAPEHSHAH